MLLTSLTLVLEGGGIIKGQGLDLHTARKIYSFYSQLTYCTYLDSVTLPILHHSTKYYKQTTLLTPFPFLDTLEPSCLLLCISYKIPRQLNLWSRRRRRCTVGAFLPVHFMTYARHRLTLLACLVSVGGVS